MKLFLQFNVPHKELVIMTPYSAQKEEIKHHLKKDFGQSIEEIDKKLKRDIENIRQRVREKKEKINRVKTMGLPKINKLEQLKKELHDLEVTIHQMRKNQKESELKLLQQTKEIEVKTITESQGKVQLLLVI